jgi:hypothetical protein
MDQLVTLLMEYHQVGKHIFAFESTRYNMVPMETFP